MTRMSLQERRNRLVDAAARVVARDGVAAATTRAIVAEADMPLASFHYAFESHSALMRQVMLKIASEDIAGIPDGNFEGTLVDAAEAALNNYLDSLHEGAPHEQALMELMHYALRTPEHRGLATEVNEMTYAGIEAALARVARDRNIRFNVPLRQIAMHMVVVTDGLTMAVLVSGDSDLTRAMVPVIARSFGEYVSEA